MKPGSSFIEKFFTAVGVGSTLILSVYLIADSLSEDFHLLFMPAVESKAWSAVAAITVIAFAYILGALMVAIADVCSRRANPKAFDREWELVKALTRAQNTVLTQQIFEILRTKQMIRGSMVPLILLAIGIFCEIRNLPNIPAVLSLFGAVVLILTVSSLYVIIYWTLDRLEKLTPGIAGSKDELQ
jgi:hypothetical protein